MIKPFFMKNLTFAFFLSVMAQLAGAQSVNFSQNVAPIIYKHCTTCHRAGEIAPFPLTSYSEVQSWGNMIKYVTSIKNMPPFKADVTYQHYQRENVLSDSEIQVISDWVTAGMPQGDPSQEPALPNFPTGSQIGTPDLVISFAQSYTHIGNDHDEYRNFVIPTGLTQDRDLIALELRPGNKTIVHHALFWADTTGQAAADDAATPEYGYSGNTAAIVANGSIDNQLPSYVPGQHPTVLSNDLAYKLKAGSDILCQFHYAPVATDQQDSSTINLFFAPQPAQRYVKSHVMIPFFGTLLNGPFSIPAGQVKEFHGTFTIPEDASMISTMPHMHYLGQSWRVFAITPNGDTVPLIKINAWDFNWQGNYDFKHLIHLPQGSVVHAFASYDNSTNNVYNPNNPPITVGWGENTSDEMYWLPLQWVSYRTGDETLELEPEDTSSTTGINDPRFYQVKDKLYPIAPNPAAYNVNIGFTLGKDNKISLRLFNLDGQLVNTLIDNQLYLQGLYTKQIDVSYLPSGIYNLELTTNSGHQTERLVVTH